MKKKLWTVVMSAVLMVGTAITAHADAYDPQYPLKGYMEPWFVTSPITGETAWKSDSNNFFYESYDFMDVAINNRDPLFLNCISEINLAAVAELAGYQTTGLEGVDQGKQERLTTELRNFLNSFDWRNASDFEKAVRIARRITQADYLSEEGTQYTYSCLVDGKANCSGYDSATRMLAACVGLPISSLGSVNHTYPVFLVDGIWLAYEPTSKDDTFTVADVYVKNGLGNYQQLGEYCNGIGYEIPTMEIIKEMFPGRVSEGLIRGERAPFIRFLNEHSSSYEYVKKNWNLPF
jgi:hypothetical protein